jgi:dihydroorotase-like cyclic amidohydrolase
MKILLKGGIIVNYNEIKDAAVLIENSTIKEIIKKKDLDNITGDYDCEIDCLIVTSFLELSIHMSI